LRHSARNFEILLSARIPERLRSVRRALCYRGPRTDRRLHLILSLSWDAAASCQQCRGDAVADRPERKS
jgi:hypothetical protein